MAENPSDFVVIVGSAASRECVGDARPHPPLQPFALAPRQRRKQIVDPLLVCSEPSLQIMRKGLQRNTRLGDGFPLDFSKIERFKVLGGPISGGCSLVEDGLEGLGCVKTILALLLAQH